MRTVAVLATVGAARAAAAPDRVAWGARRRAAPALEAEAVPRQDAPRAADDGAWWAAAKSGESAAELERMSSLLRRQLQDGAYSYLFTEGPSTMPSPQPSPMPSAMPVAQPTPATKAPTPDCGDDSLYTLTLTDTDGADGWGGETYTISSDSATVETGTLSSGAEDAVQFCLADGAYTLALSGAGTAVEFASGGLGLQSGPISVPFEAAGGEVNAAPTAKPTPAPSDAPVPAPTPKPTVSMAPSAKPIPAPTAAPVFAPTPKPTLAPVPAPTSAPTTAAVREAALAAAAAAADSGSSGGGGTPQTASAGFIVLYVVAGVVFCGLIAMLVAWQRQKERKLTERKDSWDISTMFTDEANLPDAEEMIDVEPERGGAGAALADGDGALVPLDEDQPQALQKITQVRIGVEMKIKFTATRRRRRRGPVRVYASREGAAVSRRCRSTQAAEL